MTIAIKDFEMPQSCYNCNFCLIRRTSDYGYFGMCDLTNEEGINLYEHSRSEDCPLVEAIPKADYEARLKADIEAMLEKLEQDLKAEAYGIEMFGDDLAVDVPDIEKVIQQKINSIKAEIEPQEVRIHELY